MLFFSLFISLVIIISFAAGSGNPSDYFAANVTFSLGGSNLNDEPVQLKLGCNAIATLRKPACADGEEELSSTLSLDGIRVTTLRPFTMAIAYLFESIEDCEAWENPIGGSGIYDTRGDFASVTSGQDGDAVVTIAAIRIDGSAD